MGNKTLLQYFEWYCAADGKHWERFEKDAAWILSLGITAAWLPPAYKGTRGAESEGYDVYDIYDLGEFEQKGTVRTKYGTKEQYIKAVQQARNAGLEVYVDVVLNHIGGAEETERFLVREVEAGNRTKFAGKKQEIEAYTKFTFPGRKGKHSTFQWDHQCFTGIDHAVGSDKNAIYKILNDYGEEWEPLVHNEKGNFDYLILNDIETRNPAVREELKRWGKWYYDTVQFDGVRLDAVKHINPGFFIEWLNYMRAEINPNLFALGEYWLSDDLPVLLKYIEATGKKMSLFDAPLHHNFSVASIEKNKYDLREVFNDSLVKIYPDLAVTFVDNHDTQPLQSLEEFTEQWFKPHAYALILLREEGYPCVFLPDLQGTAYQGKNKEGNSCEVSIPTLKELPALLDARKKYAYGTQTDYFDNNHCIGWTRSGINEKQNSGLAVLLSNHPTSIQKKKMYIGKEFSEKVFRNVLTEHDESIKIDEQGEGMFTVYPNKAAVFICAE